MLNKRGQGLSINAIILIILAIVVLVVIIIGFTVGWDKIAPWISSDNVDSIKTQCDSACSLRSSFDFCTKARELRAGSDRPTATCFQFANDPLYTAKGYGIGKCEEITTCPAIETG